MRPYVEKKKYLLLSVDDVPSVYLVPDVVADCIESYCNDYYEWRHKRNIKTWGIEEFIAYIDERFPEFPCEYVETIGEEFWEDDWELPKKYKRCKWYNF